jgi:hypothetical protein
MINQQVGYDKAKTTKGRKRFVLVDMMGLLLTVKVMAASVRRTRRSKAIIQKHPALSPEISPINQGFCRSQSGFGLSLALIFV